MSNKTYSQDELAAVLKGFGITDPTDVSRYGSGHINDTFKVETKSGRRYILQRVTDAFDKDILKSNILRVTNHLKAKGAKTLEVIGYENPWRVYAFLEGYSSVDVISDPAQAELAAGAFAAFQNALADLPEPKLLPVIPRFHDTVDRIRLLDEAVAAAEAAEAKVVDTVHVIDPTAPVPANYAYMINAAGNGLDYNYAAFEKDGVLEIPTLEKLELFRDIAKKGCDYAGKTVRVTGDIEIAGAWESILKFKGTFDGGSKLIAGLDKPLFGTLDGATVDNLVLEANGAQAALALASLSCVTVDTVTVGGEIAGEKAAGFIVDAAGDITVVNSVNGANVTATTVAGGFFATAKGKATFEDVHNLGALKCTGATPSMGALIGSTTDCAVTLKGVIEVGKGTSFAAEGGNVAILVGDGTAADRTAATNVTAPVALSTNYTLCAESDLGYKAKLVHGETVTYCDDLEVALADAVRDDVVLLIEKPATDKTYYLMPYITVLAEGEMEDLTSVDVKESSTLPSRMYNVTKIQNEAQTKVIGWVLRSTMVCEVVGSDGEVKERFSSIKSALNSRESTKMANGDTIRLLQDVTECVGFTENTRNPITEVTIDLNGFSLKGATAELTVMRKPVTVNAAFGLGYVENDDDVVMTIKDSRGGGSVEAAPGGYVIKLLSSYVTLNIEGGEFVCTEANGAITFDVNSLDQDDLCLKAEISGGTFTGTGSVFKMPTYEDIGEMPIRDTEISVTGGTYDNVQLFNWGVVNDEYGCPFDVAANHIFIFGGEYYWNDNTSLLNDELALSPYVFEGYRTDVAADMSHYVVRQFAPTVEVEGGDQYETMAEALAAAGNGTVKLLANESLSNCRVWDNVNHAWKDLVCSLSGAVTITATNSAITLDLGTNAVAAAGATVTFQDMTVSCTNSVAGLTGAANEIYENCTLKGDFDVKSNKLAVNGGTVAGTIALEGQKNATFDGVSFTGTADPVVDLTGGRLVAAVTNCTFASAQPFACDTSAGIVRLLIDSDCTVAGDPVAMDNVAQTGSAEYAEIAIAKLGQIEYAEDGKIKGGAFVAVTPAFIADNHKFDTNLNVVRAVNEFSWTDFLTKASSDAGFNGHDLKYPFTGSGIVDQDIRYDNDYDENDNIIIVVPADASTEQVVAENVTAKNVTFVKASDAPLAVTFGNTGTTTFIGATFEGIDLVLASETAYVYSNAFANCGLVLSNKVADITYNEFTANVPVVIGNEVADDAAILFFGNENAVINNDSQASLRSPEALTVQGDGNTFVTKAIVYGVNHETGVADYVIAAAEIGDVLYPTLNAALAAALDDDTVVMLQDAVDVGAITISNVITLDGNGKKITGNSTLVADELAGLTVSEVAFATTGAAIQTVDDYAGLLAVEDCSFDGCGIVSSDVDAATFFITKNDFTNAVNYVTIAAAAPGAAYTATIVENSFGPGADVTAPISLTGFTDASKIEADYNYFGGADDKAKVVITDATNVSYNEKIIPTYQEWERQNLEDAPMAMIKNANGTSRFYATLQDAVNAVENDETVTLLSNVAAGDNVTVDNAKTFTINLNGKTYTGAGDGGTLFTVTAGNVTLKNGNVNVAAAKKDVYKSLILDNGVLTLVDVVLDGANCQAANNATVVCATGVLTNGVDAVVKAAKSGVVIQSGKEGEAKADVTMLAGSTADGTVLLSGGAFTYEGGTYVNTSGSVFLGSSASIPDLDGMTLAAGTLCAAPHYGTGGELTFDADGVLELAKASGSSTVTIDGTALADASDLTITSADVARFFPNFGLTWNGYGSGAGYTLEGPYAAEHPLSLNVSAGTVRVTGEGEPLVREVVAEGFDQAPDSEWANRPSHVVLAKAWLPKGDRLKISVTPVSSLGVRGKTIEHLEQ